MYLNTLITVTDTKKIVKYHLSGIGDIFDIEERDIITHVLSNSLTYQQYIDYCYSYSIRNYLDSILRVPKSTLSV